jgi:quercetin dioxygenase-like cupin family protein
MGDIIRVGALELRFLQTGQTTGGALDLFEMLVPPEGTMPVPHRHRDWEETVYGMSGVTTWTVAGNAIEVGPGESLFIPRDVVHGFANRSGAPARCLSLLTPGVLGPGYFREIGAEIDRQTPPDPAKLRAIMERHGLLPEPPA